MKTILVLTDPRRHRHYLIDAISDRWKKSGYKVIIHSRMKNLPEADVVILHVDKTFVEDDYRECVSRYPLVLNRNVADISKKTISNHIVEKDENYSGPVIIKTNANCGGLPEASKFQRLYIRLSSKWNMRRNFVGNPDKYPVLENKEMVPDVVWNNQDLVVERFLPEMEDGLFYLRYWIFLGEKGWAGRFGAREPVVKFNKMTTRDEEVPVPEELKIVRKKLGFDYGRFDYVVRDGKPVLFDVNKTIGGAYHLDDYAIQIDSLAEGIHDY